jgi:hypothetical protein
MVEEVMYVRRVVGFAVSAAVALACGSTPAPEEGLLPDDDAVQTASYSENVCADLRERMAKLRIEIQTCDPKGKTGCDIVVQDLCCPISAGGGPIEDFEILVEKYKENCHYACTHVVCPDPKQAVCGADGQCHP